MGKPYKHIDMGRHSGKKYAAYVVTVRENLKLKDELVVANARIKELERELAEAQKDTGRLEWMIRQRFRINPEIIDDDGPFWTILKSREAIDEAIRHS